MTGSFKVKKRKNINQGYTEEERTFTINDPIEISPKELKNYLEKPQYKRPEFILKTLVDLDTDWLESNEENTEINIEPIRIDFLASGTEEDIKDYIRNFVQIDTRTDSPEEFVDRAIKTEENLRGVLLNLINEDNIDL